MDNFKMKTPICPKCNGHNTSDINPNLPDVPLTDEDYYGAFTTGNAKYYCLDCDHKWKKYRGKKPYKRIKKIFAYVGGYPGPNYEVEIDLEDKTIQHNTLFYDRSSLPLTIPEELTETEIDWLLEELYKCDYINWAERYDWPGTMDGTHWSTRIVFDTHCEIKQGSNHFPAKWIKFCKAMSRLSNMDFS